MVRSLLALLALLVLAAPAPAPAPAAAACGERGERTLARAVAPGGERETRFLRVSGRRLVHCHDGRRRVLARLATGTRAVMGTLDSRHVAVALRIGRCRGLRIRSWRASDGRPAIDARVEPGACNLRALHAARSGSVALIRDDEVLFAEKPGVRSIARGPGVAPPLASGPTPLVTWRHGAEAGTGAVIDRRRCSVPPARGEVVADARVVVHTAARATGDDLFEDGTYGGLLVCRREEGVTRLLARTWAHFGGGESVKMLRVRYPWVAWVHSSWTRTTGGSTAVRVADLRTLQTVTHVGAGWEQSDVRRLLLAESGAVAYSLDDPTTSFGGEPFRGIRAGLGKASGVLDDGPAVDLDSLALEGHTVSWLSGGERRTAELP